MKGTGRSAKRLARFFVRRLFPPPERDPAKMRDIWREARSVAVLASSGIGDSLMATPLLEALRRRRPEMRVIVVSAGRYADVFRNHPSVDLLLMDDGLPGRARSLLRVATALRHEQVDVFLAAQPSNTVRHSLLAAASGARIRLKHAYDYGEATERDWSFVFSALLEDSMERHRTELDLDLLRFLGEEIGEGRLGPTFPVGKAARAHVDDWLAGGGGGVRPLVALHPGGVRENKRWPAVHFAAVARRLLDEGFEPCLVGGDDEGPLRLAVATSIGCRVLDAGGRFSLEETAALLERCVALVTNDTGVMHLATSVGTRVVAIFGPTDHRHIGPRAPDARVLKRSATIADVTVAEVLMGLHETVAGGEPMRPGAGGTSIIWGGP